MHIRNIVPLLLLLPVFLLLYSCRNCEPQQDQGNLLIINFVDTSARIDSLKKSFRTVQAFDNNGNVVDVPRSNSPKDLYYRLPLNPNQTTMLFGFEEMIVLDKALADDTVYINKTLLVGYSTTASVDPPDCDFFLEYTDITINYTTFDSLNLRYNFIQSYDTLRSNITVYF